MKYKNYNSLREKLLLPEYGRHIQKMVDYLVTIEDRETRNKMAHCVIAAMGNINTTLRDTTNFRHKLWDHLFILSKFKLDVDSPYKDLDSTMFEYQPKRLSYPKGIRRHKQYGNNVKSVINSIKNLEDSAERTAVAISAAKFMKVKSFEYNREYPSDEIIINDIKQFSDGQISLDEDTLNSTKLNYRTHNKPKVMAPKRRVPGGAMQPKRRPMAGAPVVKSSFRPKSK